MENRLEAKGGGYLKKGMFITFEGVEGCGKTTQMSLAADRLRAMGHTVETTREPGGTPAGAAVRKILLSPDTGDLDPMTELLLFSAARRELITRVIRPALETGAIVLCDRFADSTTAYQGYGRGLDMELIRKITETTLDGLWPDLTIVLDVPAEEGLKRANGRMEKEGRGEARFENEDVEFHRRVRQGFLDIAKREPGRVKVVDSTRPLEAVSEATLWIMKETLGL